MEIQEQVYNEIHEAHMMIKLHGWTLFRNEWLRKAKARLYALKNNCWDWVV